MWETLGEATPELTLNLKLNVIRVDKDIQVCLTSARFGRSSLNHGGTDLCSANDCTR
jgi:hypothetical protein